VKAQTSSLITPIHFLLSSAIYDLVAHSDSKFYYLRALFISPQCCSVEKFEQVIEDYSLDIEEEIESATEKVIDLVVGLNNLWKTLPITFEDLLETSEVDAAFELLGATGDSTRFWDNYELQDFGLTQLPPLVTIESLYEEAYLILEKVRVAKRKVMLAKFSDMRKAA